MPIQEYNVPRRILPGLLGISAENKGRQGVMGKMTKPVRISFISKVGIKVRKPLGTLTKPTKIAFLGKTDIKARG